MLRHVSILGLILFLFSCQEEIEMDFSHRSFSSKENSKIFVLIPEAKGSSLAAKNINRALTQFTCEVLNIDASKTAKTQIDESIKQFDNSYSLFKKHISKELSIDLPVWQAHIDGEILFKNKNLISMAMNSSINTGSAKNNLSIEFFNFDPSTGKKIVFKTLINDWVGFKQLVKKYYTKELVTNYSRNNSSLANEEIVFELPKSIGFNDQGILFFYNTYELLMPSTETMEFTIPYESANKYLTF